MQPSRDRKQKITDTIAHLKHKEPQSPRIVVLEQELVRAEAESLVAEAQLSNITREKLKAAFNYQFDAMREHSEKLALIAGYGKHLLDLVDDTPVTPGENRPAYDSYDTSKQIIVDCENALSDWTLDTASVKSTLSIRRPKKKITHRGNGEDLSQQDKPLERESSLWVPASEHEKVIFLIHNLISRREMSMVKRRTRRKKGRESKKRKTRIPYSLVSRLELKECSAQEVFVL